MWIGRPLIHRRHEEFFKSIDQSIAVMEFRVYVFFFHSQILRLDWITMLDCIAATTSVRRYFVSLFQKMYTIKLILRRCVRFKCCLWIWSPYGDCKISSAIQQHWRRSFNEEFFESIRFVNLCTHTHAHVRALGLSVDHQLKTKSIAGSDHLKKTKQQPKTRQTDRRIDRQRENLSAICICVICINVNFKRCVSLLPQNYLFLLSRYCLVLLFLLASFCVCVCGCISIWSCVSVWVFPFGCVYDSHYLMMMMMLSDHPSIVANPLLLSVLLCAVATAAVILNWIRAAYQTFFFCFLFLLYLYDCVYAFNVILYWCCGTSAMIKINKEKREEWISDEV